MKLSEEIENLRVQFEQSFSRPEHHDVNGGYADIKFQLLKRDLNNLQKIIEHREASRGAGQRGG